MMAKCPPPKPMPTTGMPDRLETDKVSPPPMNLKAGVSTTGNMHINPGRKGD